MDIDGYRKARKTPTRRGSSEISTEKGPLFTRELLLAINLKGIIKLRGSGQTWTLDEKRAKE